MGCICFEIVGTDKNNDSFCLDVYRSLGVAKKHAIKLSSDFPSLIISIEKIEISNLGHDRKLLNVYSVN